MHAVPTIQTAEGAGEDWVPLFREQYPTLVRLAARILGCQVEAEDVAAEAFVKLVGSTETAKRAGVSSAARAWARERPAVHNPVGWLKRCAMYLALDRLRSNQRRASRERLAPASRNPESPESELIVLEEQARVRFVLSELPQRDAALLLGRADGYSYRELAELAGIRPTSTGALLARAERRFKERYEHHYGAR